MPQRSKKFVNFWPAPSILLSVEELGATDAALAGRVCGGEVEAMAALIERYRPALYATAIRVLRNRDDALDAVQEACVVALVQLGSLRDPAAVGGWLRAVVRNVCLMRLRRVRRETPLHELASVATTPTPEDVLEHHALRDWVWAALDTLGPDERIALTLRHFSRCDSYQAIAAVTGVPIGTVRSRLNRARAQLTTALAGTIAGSPLSHATLEEVRRREWQDFYAALHETPEPRTYRDLLSPDVDVTDGVGRWRGVDAWSDHEREAIVLGVRAAIVGLVASRDITILEIDFTNPAWASDHCPPRSTFVHHLAGGRSRRLDIHYV